MTWTRRIIVGVLGLFALLAVVNLVIFLTWPASGRSSRGFIDEIATTGATAGPHPTLADSGGAGIPLQVDQLQSLRGLMEIHSYVVVGRVEQGAELYYEPEGIICPVPFTIFNVTVERQIAAPAGEDSKTLPVILQTGQEQEGCVVADGAGEKPLEVGQQYLFFLEDRRPAGGRGFSGFHVARFELTDDGKIVPNGTEVLYAGASEISGVTAEEVSAALSASDAKAALELLANVTVDQLAVQVNEIIETRPSTAPSQ
jgi:hypothetical protein